MVSFALSREGSGASYLKPFTPLPTWSRSLSPPGKCSCRGASYLEPFAEKLYFGPRGGSLDHRSRFSLVFLLLHYSTHRTKQARRGGLDPQLKQLVNVRRSPGEQERPPRFPEGHRLVQTESQNREQAQPVSQERGANSGPRICS